MAIHSAIREAHRRSGPGGLCTLGTELDPKRMYRDQSHTGAYDPNYRVHLLLWVFRKVKPMGSAVHRYSAQDIHRLKGCPP